ncbi:hypothetical protein HX127_00930 [Acinetobacter sp. 256-1]|uniref:hypothetical protein n=1 Tax=Acinetobacter sp. 256-1 TaxID=2746721 RepID=UPI0025779891|nr:hypothetical protein [Acinetobacter sp. 256-1]MDM1756148.1 hypothetical protein [Acinetobacter sp. 256-1]
MKKLKRLYLRPHDTPFIWLASFVCAAEKEKWAKEEIRTIVQTVRPLDRDTAYEFLMQFIE